ncbi:MAG: extracellular solute-binding protein [Candidatus Fournierella pullistercoris]|uniref:beta-fructofuranosidase n=1 Tax=Candidatus Allofournierella pullistercoris TaxID=2838597 RepID=A0A948T1R9_9FIRM|nr:extracellular solute-binding protein [Candidatus Fournierella pullistercoris]
MKRFVALATLMAFTLSLTACGGGNAAPTESTTNIEQLVSEYGFQWADTSAPILNDAGAQAITFNVYSSKNASALDYNDMKIMQDLKANTNVTVNWENVSESVYSEQKNLIFGNASNRPDAIYHAGMSPGEVIRYAQRNVLLPISDYLEYMPNFSKILEEPPDIRAQLTSEDGKIYTLPRVEEMGLLQNPNLLFLNKNWTKQAIDAGVVTGITEADLVDGLTLTSDQMEDILAYFRDNDMNGNGKTDDERPLSLVYNNWQGNQCDLYGMFGLNDNLEHRVVVDGKVTYTVQDERFKDTLHQAREFESRYGPMIPEEQRPVYHLTPTIGWMNDPNGFSYYKGEYHLFYQYHPYSTEWGPMHWGHAKTRDFLHWERLPTALAPDEEYDQHGCFSGSAVELPDALQMLVYTAVRKHLSDDGRITETQTQALAVGDGVNYEKWPANPVLTADDLPQGGSPVDFRDPKAWREPDGSYRLVVANRTPDGSGAVLLYRSDDGFRWTLVGTVDASQNQYGQMWECPDFFPLDGKWVLLVSPQEMSPIGLEFHAGHATLCLIGNYDAETNSFTRESVQAIDYGIDFYAPQTVLTPDGRRIMIGWMQNWNTLSCKPRDGRWFGQMSIPRKLSIRDGRLYQMPVRELYHSFRINVAKDGEYVTSIRYRPNTSILKIDRTRSGSNADVVHTRSLLVRPQDGHIKLRILLDRCSVEVFVNDGEQAVTASIITRQSAGSISFDATGSVLMDVEKYDIDLNRKGDTFCACVLNFLLNHGLDGLTEDDLTRMLHFANTAAYLVTTRKGAIRSMPTPEQVLELM